MFIFRTGQYLVTFNVGKVGLHHHMRVGVAQSVKCVTTDWTTGRPKFDPWQRREDISSSFYVQTGSEAHPASFPMGIGVLSPGIKHGRVVTLTTHPN
jgi:hypothetical protein